jgi:hypothetical protein
MIPEPELEDRLRAALGRPEGSAWPDERGAFDRFLRRRRRTVAAGALLALVTVLAGAVVLPALVPGRPTAPVSPVVPAAPAKPVVPAGPVVWDPARGFEVPIPAGWKMGGDNAPSKPGRPVEPGTLPPPSQEPSFVELVPEGKASPPTKRIVLSTQVLDPEQHPGLPPGEDPGGVANRTGSFFALDDRASPLGHGRRPDGRPYVWRTRLLPDEVGEYAITWPYYCRADRPCPQGNRWRVLTVDAGRSDDPAVRRELRRVAQQVIDTVRPITNALPGGDPAHLDPVFSSQPPATTPGPITTMGAPVSTAAPPRP